MYVPRYYAQEDRVKLFAFMHANSFGILFSHTGEEPMASHLPFMIDEKVGGQGLIYGHMAKANRQWRYADGQQVMVVFHGPHAYVSPTWYQEDNVVPTWDYVAVHAIGIFKALEGRSDIEESVSHLTDLPESSQPNKKILAKSRFVYILRFISSTWVPIVSRKLITESLCCCQSWLAKNIATANVAIPVTI